MSTKQCAELIESLATSVGEEEARAVVHKERERLGYGETLTIEQASKLLQAIEQRGGPAGLGARLVRIRLDRASNLGVAGSSGAGRLALPRFTTRQVVDMFASALGQEKAAEVVKAAMTQLGAHGDELTFDQVSRVLDALGRQAGVVSTVARFAKARLLLKGSG